MIYLYGQEVPMEEVDEMLAVLKAIQKHQREISLLRLRTMTMCPTLMDGAFGSPLYTFLNYRVDSNAYEHRQGLQQRIDEIVAYKKQAQAEDM